MLHVSPNGLDADVGLSSNRATQIGDRVMIKRNMREETSEYKDFDETTYLEDLMTRSPQDDSANLCVKVAVACPEVSLVVDQSASLKAGAALFSLRLGHRDQDDRPILDYCGDSEDSSELGNNEKVNVNSSIVEGCPISVFTSGGIRVITQVSVSQLFTDKYLYCNVCTLSPLTFEFRSHESRYYQLYTPFTPFCDSLIGLFTNEFHRWK